jgi:PTS system N-acetylglucosamine-specific IIC component
VYIKFKNRRNKNYRLAERYIKALGGVDNIKEFSACATRLRLTVNDVSLVKEKAILRRGALGVTVSGGDYVQIVIGKDVYAIYDAMCDICGVTNATQSLA